MMAEESLALSKLRSKLAFEPPVFVTPLRANEDSSRTVYLSHIDQFFNYCNAIALFYAPAHPPKSTENLTGLVRCALEELLVYYPWAAGRLRVNEKEKRLEVDCNGEGVQFVVATAGLSTADLGDITTPRPATDLLFARIENVDADLARRPLVALQVTRFLCGGFVVSMMSNHVLMDGHSAVVFLQNLSSLARGESFRTLPDDADRRQRIVPRNPPSPCFDHPHIIEKEDPRYPAPQYPYGNAVKYSFSKEMVEKLRVKALSQGSGVTSCSRYQALAAHLWISKAKSMDGLDESEELPLRVPVNARERRVPPIPRGYMGNVICLVEAKAKVKELRENSLSFAVKKVQEATERVTEEYVQSEIDMIEVLGGAGVYRRTKLSMPSLAGMPFYDTDLGWGRPVYCARPCEQYINRLIVLDGEAGRRSLNVLIVFASPQERTKFEAAITLA